MSTEKLSKFQEIKDELLAMKVEILAMKVEQDTKRRDKVIMERYEKHMKAYKERKGIK